MLPRRGSFLIELKINFIIKLPLKTETGGCLKSNFYCHTELVEV
jgi:hypothetical protein